MSQLSHVKHTNFDYKEKVSPQTREVRNYFQRGGSKSRMEKNPKMRSLIIHYFSQINMIRVVISRKRINLA
jgi:hypothetical protein